MYLHIASGPDWDFDLLESGLFSLRFCSSEFVEAALPDLWWELLLSVPPARLLEFRHCLMVAGAVHVLTAEKLQRHDMLQKAVAQSAADVADLKGGAA